MEALLPSEISRLVLGYLEETSCTAAYQTFLESCPHLKECAEAALQGYRFSTRAAGRSLRDILTEYCLIYTIVQDRIQKLPENSASQLKGCGITLADQVKQLIDGKQTGQRFHVNITVPQQAKVSKARLVGSRLTPSPMSSQNVHMATPTSSRMRRTSHPLQEQRLTLRSEDPKEDVTASVTVQRIETALLDSAPSQIDGASNISHPIRKLSKHENRARLESSEGSACDYEEQNPSDVNIKTAELSGSSGPNCAPASKLNQCLSSVLAETDSPHCPSREEVETNAFSSVRRHSGEQNPDNRSSFMNHSESGSTKTSLDGANGRSSLDKLLLNILSVHEVNSDTDVSPREVDTTSTEVMTSNEAGIAVTPVDGCLLSRSPKQCDISATGISHLVQKNFESTRQNMPHKNVDLALVSTPMKSAAKRKTKPTPLKMITPTKSKGESDPSDSGDVMIDPKIFFDSLLDNRQLHEKIAENINQFIRPSTVEADTNVREANEPLMDTAAPLGVDGKSSKELSTQEELEKVIKTVVDKTESDPLFESLLCEILGPDNVDDGSINSPSGVKSTRNSSRDGVFINTKCTDGGRENSSTLLEDQNEAAIKSILEAQPSIKDPRQGKRLTVGSPCQSSLDNNEVNKGKGSEDVCDLVGERKNELEEDGNKLIILPFQDIMQPTLPFPTFIINGVAHGMVAPSQQSLKGITTNETLNIIPGNPPFILRQINPVDVNGLNLNNSAATDGIVKQCSVSSNIESTLNAVISYSEPLVPQSVSIGAEVLPVQNDSGASLNSNSISQFTHKDGEKTTANPPQCRPLALLHEVHSGGPSGLTPDVVNSRPLRAATEGRSKKLNDSRETPLMSSGNRRHSMSTPRRKSRGHVRALDFGGTPPKQAEKSDSLNRMVSTSTPADCRRQPEARKSLPSKLLGKQSKHLGIPGTLSDLNITGIATRSPPPRLSGAWNKGVDLIFGCDSSPNDPLSSPPTNASGKSEESVCTREQRGDSQAASKNSLKKESPSTKTKVAWDAALRASLGDTQDKPKVTKEKKKCAVGAGKKAEGKKAEGKKAEREGKKNKAEDRKGKRVGKRRKKENGDEGKADCNEDIVSSYSVDNQEACANESPVERKDTLKAICKEDSSHISKNKQNLISKNSKENYQLSVARKRKLNSSGDEVAKKKAVGQPLIVPDVVDLESKSPVPTASPEKTWVVQQSPGSWANKRSLHDVLSHQNDSEGGPTAIGSARKCLDLHETPKKTDSAEMTEGRLVSGGEKQLTGCDRSTLTVVDTPLFPPTPNISCVGTPMSRDASEAMETFPSYFNPRDKESLISKGKGCDSNAISKLGDESLSENSVLRKNCIDIPVSDGSVSSDCNKAIEGADENDGSIEPNVIGKDGRAVDQRNSQVRILKSKSNQRGAAAVKLPNSPRPKASMRQKEDGGKESSEDEVSTRVLRPRKLKTNYFGVQVVGEQAKKEETGGREKAVRRRVPSRRKSCKYAEPDSIPNIVAEEDIEASLVYNPLAPEVVCTQSQEAEELAKQISLKLSPLVSKTSDLEEEQEEDDDQDLDGPSGKDYSHAEGLGEDTSRHSGERGSSRSSESTSSESDDYNEDSDSQLNSPSSHVPTSAPLKSQDEPNEKTDVSSGTLMESKNCGKESVEGSSSSNKEPAGNSVEINTNLSNNGLDVSVDMTLEEQLGKIVIGCGNTENNKESVEISESVIRDDENLSRRFEEVPSMNDTWAINIERRGAAGVESDDVVSSSEKIVKSCGIEDGTRMGDESGRGLGNRAERMLSESVDGRKMKRANINDGQKSSESPGDMKKRRDYLEKILFGKDDNETEYDLEMSETGGGAPISVSIADHRLSSELELKRQRTLERLKGGKIGRKVGVGRRVGIHTQQNSILSSMAGLTPDALVQAVGPPEIISPSIFTKVSPSRSVRKVAAPCAGTIETSNVTVEEEDDDCPTLRLSEGEELEFRSPEKCLVSPSKFELLVTLEERIASLHRDPSSPGIKKTARMSCTATATCSVSISPSKEHSKEIEPETALSNRMKSQAEFKKNVIEKDPDPIASTSRAAEIRFRAEERKYLSKSQPTTSGIKIRESCRGSTKSVRSCSSALLKTVDDDLVVINDPHSSDQPLDYGKDQSENVSKCKQKKHRRSPLEQNLTPHPEMCVSSSSKYCGKSPVADTNERNAFRSANTFPVEIKELIPSECLCPSSQTKRVKKRENKAPESSLRGKERKGYARHMNGKSKERSTKAEKSVVAVVRSDENPCFVPSKESEGKKSHSTVVPALISEDVLETSLDCASTVDCREKMQNNIHSVGSDGNQGTGSIEVLSVCNVVTNNESNPTFETLKGLCNIGIKKGQPISNSSEQQSLSAEAIAIDTPKQPANLNLLEPCSLKDGRSECRSFPNSTISVDRRSNDVDQNDTCIAGDSLKAPASKSNFKESESNEIGTPDDSGHEKLHTLPSNSAVVPLSAAASVDDQMNHSVCSQVEPGDNNTSWSTPVEVSFNSNEAYISLVYDEDHHLSKSDMTCLPLSPPSLELEGMTVELDDEIVTITKSDYIELFSFTPHDIVDDKTCKVDVRNPRMEQGKSKRSKDADGKERCQRSREERKKSTQVKDRSGSSRMSCRSDFTGKNVLASDAQTDKEMASIERVVEACHVKQKNSGNSVDDDSLMTFAIVEPIGSEESNKEDSGTRKILPLKKRRTTAEDMPGKFPADGESHPGMFFPLNGMEIEDFLSKVHGD